MKTLTVTARRIRIRGSVQGVGFRPFVYRLAVRYGLAGHIGNRSGDVEILVEGEPDALDAFEREIRTRPPAAARIDQLTVEQAAPSGGDRFVIADSTDGPQGTVPISADLATCDRCLEELFDPHSRWYRYPFTSCTDCGPRYTIVRETPYDRCNTSMATFQMCPVCRGEFDDPSDRRFHAQANACPECGPQVQLVDAAGACLPADDPLRAAAAQLCAGRIIAVKGLGGYHLAVDATNESAVQELRSRKAREKKPFAVMAQNLESARAFCMLSPEEERALSSIQRPIVLLRRWERNRLAASVSTGSADLGLMLAYSPLHHLLLSDIAQLSGGAPLLVMTSGNLSGEPIACGDDEALRDLGGIADLFLMHNRPIENRCDDAVVSCPGGKNMILRRSRGDVPTSITVGFDFPEPILACGAQLKSTVCVATGRTAIVGPHLGDLDRYRAQLAFRDSVVTLTRLAQIEPSVLAHDLHPEYSSTRFALDRHDLTTVAVQHHHAHIAAVIAEHGIAESVIGVAFDGTGYGTDDCIWGGEFLIADCANFVRAAHLDYLPLPGGDQAVRQPWRMAVAHLKQSFGDEFTDLDLPFLQHIDPKQLRLLNRMIDRNVNCPLTSSMGRLFDAVAALVLLRDEVTFEGQAAMELEAIADLSVEDGYQFTFRPGSPNIIVAAPVIRAIVDDLRFPVAAPVVSARFHNAVAAMIVVQCELLRADHHLNQVALSGGVFQNRILLTKTLSLLEQSGFQVFTNNCVPINDGGISFGQAAVAAARLEQ